MFRTETNKIYKIFLLIITVSNCVYAESIEDDVLEELYAQCSPNVNPKTLNAIIEVESAKNQYAIAVVDGDSLNKQPDNEKDALETLRKLSNKNISVGLMQINKANWETYNTNAEELVTDMCKNIYVGEDIIFV